LTKSQVLDDRGREREEMRVFTIGQREVVRRKAKSALFRGTMLVSSKGKYLKESGPD